MVIRVLIAAAALGATPALACQTSIAELERLIELHRAELSAVHSYVGASHSHGRAAGRREADKVLEHRRAVVAQRQQAHDDATWATRAALRALRHRCLVEMTEQQP